MVKAYVRYFLLCLCLLIAACAGGEKVATRPSPSFEPTSFSALPNWGRDRVAGALPALRKSCARMQKRSAQTTFKAELPQGKIYGEWQNACRALAGISDQDYIAARRYFETYFTPFAVKAGSETVGLFTGYYEASLRGSRTRGGAYQTPLYVRPDDLVMVDLGEFRDELKGQRIAGRVRGGKLKPYEDRSAIVGGQWPHNDKVLVWVDSPVDAFFVQIQGSGVVQLNDGSVMRIGYAGQNGHPYYAIGRELIKRGALTKENVSMQSIRAWLEQNPSQANEIMNTNKSYVFFEEKNQGGAIGAEGVVLTPQRSLAVDRTVIPYGAPLWVDIDPPVANMQRLQKIMVAQDTGGAIRGAVRGDVFWGFGAQAEDLAGKMKSKGQYWILLPR